MTGPVRGLAVVCAALLLAACGSTQGGGSSSPAAPPLEGTAWVLTGWADEAGAVRGTVPAASQGELVLADRGGLQGSTGCNRFTGTWMASGSALTITLGGVTEMACAPAVMAQEAAVLAALPAVASYTVTDDVLTLTDSAGATVLTYAAGATSLAGTSWRATGINNGTGGVETTADTAKVTAVFAPDGSLTGFAGCNSYSSTWTTSGANGLALDPVQSTQMACDALPTESQYLAALATVATYEIVGDRLTLRDSSGATQVTYARTARASA